MEKGIREDLIAGDFVDQKAIDFLEVLRSTELTEGMKKGELDLADIYGGLTSSVSLTNILDQKVLPNIKQDIFETAKRLKDIKGVDFAQQLESTITTFIKEGRIKQIASDIRRDLPDIGRRYTQKELETSIGAYFGTQIRKETETLKEPANRSQRRVDTTADADLIVREATRLGEGAGLTESGSLQTSTLRQDEDNWMVIGAGMIKFAKIERLGTKCVIRLKCLDLYLL